MKYSVAMATYQGADFVERQVDSVLNQSLPPEEIIVCDDRSVDKTAEKLQKYTGQDLLTYYSNEKQLGVVSNFKRAVSLTKTNNWIALADQDDIWLPDKMKRSVALMQQINDENVPCIVYSDLILMDENDQIINTSFRKIFRHNKYQHNLETLLFTNFVVGCTVLMNVKAKEWFINMPEDVQFHDEWLALIAFAFGRAVSIDAPLVKYRKHETNVSMPGKIKAYNRISNLIKQGKKALIRNDDFLKRQFEVVDKFYECYLGQLTEDKRNIIGKFLSLKERPYLVKKLTYSKVVRKYGL